MNAALLSDLLRCDPNAGKLVWLPRPVSMFSGKNPKKAADLWNGRYANKEAGTGLNSKGYKTIGIFNKTFHAHRVIWAMVHGDWPECEIDHMNGNRADNKISNLRHVTSRENKRNRCLSKQNTSGFFGVGWHAGEKKWRAEIGVNGRKVSLGYFTRKADAILARRAAEIKYGFHENHGRKPL